MKKQKTIPKVRIQIKPSKILKGEVGVFACRDIKKDEVVVDVEQFNNVSFFSWDYFKSLDTLTQKKIYGYCSGNEEGFFAPPDLNYISIGWHLNHSCNPNIGFDKKFNFIAMKDIKKGSELFWDYAFDETNQKFKMRCSCGAKNCRKIVRGDDWKTLVKDKDIFNYLSPDIKNLYLKHKAYECR